MPMIFRRHWRQMPQQQQQWQKTSATNCTRSRAEVELFYLWPTSLLPLSYLWSAFNSSAAGTLVPSHMLREDPRDDRYVPVQWLLLMQVSIYYCKRALNNTSTAPIDRGHAVENRQLESRTPHQQRQPSRISAVEVMLPINNGHSTRAARVAGCITPVFFFR